jgi:tRNA pseudouridine13 synthase
MKRSINMLDTAEPLTQVTQPAVSKFILPALPFAGRPAERPVLKKFPHDFLVSESLVLPRRFDIDDPKFSYLKLTKSGFTTFEAITKIAQYFQISPEQVLFTGLKDEDAITEQLLAIPSKISRSTIESFNCESGTTLRGFMELQYCFTGDEPLVIGRLNGNSFRIIVRNLSPQFVERFSQQVRYTFQFLNYYDTQRFGVAGQAKTSHHVGKALADGDCETAFEILKRAGTPESRKALGFDGAPEDFFKSISPRVINFLKDSYSSYLWNGKLSALVRQVCGDEVYEECCETIPFLFTWKQSLILSTLKEQPSIEFPRFHDVSNGANPGPKLRATVVQTQVHCNGVEPDQEHLGAYLCDLSFFLPSGCYATMCIRQLVNMMDLTS